MRSAKVRLFRFMSMCLMMTLAFGACGDDKGDEDFICGNGVREGTEECDGADLGGHDCTTLGLGFTGGTLACHSYCLFDTSGCTGGVETCGNGVLDPGEECDGENLGGNTCGDVGNYVGGTLSCNADCTFNTDECQAHEDCGNGVIDEGEDCDGDELGGNTCEDVGDYLGGVLACRNDCTFDVSGCWGGEGASAQIMEARTTADGTVLIPIQGAYVTYMKPEVANDPPGFTVQAELEGPALYINVDPATLDPQPQVGDLVAFTVTQLNTLWAMRHAAAITDWEVHGSGFDVNELVQDITDKTDVISQIQDYDTELVAATVDIVGSFGSAGTGYLSARIETAGISGNDNYLIRLPSALNDNLDLQPGCAVHILGTPLWRYNTVAQVSAWTMDDIAIASCPQPLVTGAIAAEANTVTVTFNRALDPATVQPSHFTFDQGLTASAAVTDGKHVILTTSNQTVSTIYTVTVSGAVQDIGGAGVDQTANQAQFAAFGSGEMFCSDGIDNDGDGYIDCLDADCAGSPDCVWPETLLLWELDADTPGTDDREFIEIFNNTGSAVDFETERYYVLFINGNGNVVYRALRLTGVLPVNGLFLMGNPGVVPTPDLTFPNNTLQNGEDAVLLVRCDGCHDTASTSFPNAMGFAEIGTSPTFTSADGHSATKIDGIAYHNDHADNPTLWSMVGVDKQWNENMNNNGPYESLQRIGPDRWLAVPPTPGVVGMQGID